MQRLAAYLGDEVRDTAKALDGDVCDGIFVCHAKDGYTAKLAMTATIPTTVARPALLVAPILTEQTFQREVCLPAGSWTNLLTGEKLTGGKTVTVKAGAAQVPVFLNNDSKDVAALASIFAGKTRKDILAL